VRWATLVPLLKDLVLSGTGVFAILYEVLNAHPNGLVLGTGLALTVPSVADHVKALLPSSGGGSSSEPSPSQTPPPSPPSSRNGRTGSE
jgi:hypothetical protein